MVSFSSISLCLGLRTCRNQSLAGCIALILRKVLDETLCEILCLLVPLLAVRIGITRIKDSRIHTRKLGRHFKIKERNLLGRCLQHVAVQDGIDNTSRVLNRNSLAAAVPAGIHKVCLCTALLHALHKLFRILGRMQLEESLTEASRESRGRLGDAALGSRELCRKAGQEVILGLLRRQNGDRRQYAKRIRREENDILRCRSVGNRLYNLLDMIDRIGNTGILRDTLVGEINLTICIDRDILEECVAADCIVDVRLGFLVEVDDLGIASALKVEDAGIIPAVLVIADQKTLRIGRERGLTGARETKEHSRVLAVHIVFAEQCIDAMPRSGR